VSYIQFIKSDKNYLEIYIPNKKHLVIGKLSDFMEAIDQITPRFLTINHTEIPIEAKYKEALKTRLTLFQSKYLLLTIFHIGPKRRSNLRISVHQNIYG
jgi:hypothetical protein